MAEATKEFMKQLRKDVKNNASNWKVLQLLERTYEEGFRQGILHSAERIKELGNAGNQIIDNGGHVDGELIQPTSSIDGGSDGSNAIDGHISDGSGEAVQASDDNQQDGPSV